MLRSRVLIPTVLLAVLASGVAVAEPLRLSSGYSSDPAIAVTEARLSYTDADLATAAGARAMLGRIEAAAAAVCGEAGQGAAVCRDEAVRGAVARLGHPAVRELASRRMSEHAVR